MTSSPLLDLLAREGRAAAGVPQREELIRLLHKVITATLEDYKRIGEYEQSLAALPPTDDETDHQRFTLIYELYRAWAREAEAVVAGLPSLKAVGIEPDDVEALYDAMGFVGARLKLTPEKIARARQQVRDGQTIPIEDIRREIQARRHA
jgi:hypothetical protein